MTKKRSKKNTSSSFSASPFKSLKGFAVSDEEALPVLNEPVEPQQEQTLSEESDGDLFAREMERLGLDRSGGEAGDEDSLTVASQGENPERTAARDAGEEEDFLSAMRELRVDFKDEVSEQVPDVKPSARRERQLRRGQLEPEAELDLHGLTRDQAREKVGFFLDDARYQGVRTVLIITGRGHGSSGEPVLRTEVERLLRLEQGKSVMEWMVAPRRYGGAGALVVFLKK